MKTINEKQTTIHSKLKLGLSQFGLCPNDWNIEPKNKDFVLIKNKIEENFYFIGKIKMTKQIDSQKEQLAWQFITLAGL
jgi:hypothetical protein